jgi:hypothetical protein
VEVAVVLIVVVVGIALVWGLLWWQVRGGAQIEGKSWGRQYFGRRKGGST